MELANDNELSRLKCEKLELCDIVAIHLAALKCGRQLSRLFPKRGGVPVMETLRATFSSDIRYLNELSYMGLRICIMGRVVFLRIY